MLKKAITYEGFDGEDVTETFYFNLTKAELVELEVSHKQGLEASLRKIIADEDGEQILAELKKIIKKSYGIRSPDGNKFIKTEEAWQEFSSSEAYSALFMEMLEKEDAASSFINGIVPKSMVDANQTELDVARPNLTPGPKKLTQDEIVAMDVDELKSGLATGRYIT